MAMDPHSNDPASSSPTNRPVVGWREWLSLPELGIPGIKAKVDTGARTSALHTGSHEIFTKDGQAWVRFVMHPLTTHPEIAVDCEAPLSDTRQVKDSGGHAEIRPFIRTLACLGDYQWEIELSLTDREAMKFRMLLGRTAMRGRFLVDPRASRLLSKDLRHAYRKPR